MAMEAPREYVRFEIVDMNGQALSKTVPMRHKDGGAFMFCGAIAVGANMESMHIAKEVLDAGCPNVRLVPDWDTEQELPFASKPGVIVKRVYCEMGTVKGAFDIPVPRKICRKLLEELKEASGLGLEALVGGELEFTLAKPDGDSWKPYFDGVNVFSTLQNNKAMDYCYELERTMEPLGVDILTINAEYGAGQLEMTFAPKFGIEAVDNTCTFRTGAKEVAQNKGLRASFISRPFGVDGVGNGGHFNFSLWTPTAGSSTDMTPVGSDFVSRETAGMSNAFHSSEDPDGLSALARSFLAGVLEHARALEAVCAPTPCCYTRHGHWAPDVANWGIDNRFAAVRVKADKDGSPSGCYMEVRMPSASANPYLVLTGVIAAGMDGVARSLQLPPAGQTKDDGATPLPTSLEEALVALEADSYMCEKLGLDFVRWFSGCKRGEDAFIQNRVKGGSGSNEELAAAWQHMYMEFV